MGNASLWSSTRRIAGVAAAGMVASSIALATPASADEPDVTRVDGETRYGTALEAAEKAFGASPETVILASGEDFPDALAGSALAGCLDAPILLTPQDGLPEGLDDYLTDGGSPTRNYYVLGGTAAVSAGVVGEIASLIPGQVDVTRIGGADRYETAELIAEEFYPDGDGECAGQTAGIVAGEDEFEAVAILATGEDYPDALAAGSQAFAGPHPVLLSKSAVLSDEADDALEGLDADGVVVMGGDAALSTEGVVDELDPDVVVTVAGENRYDTARILATTLVSLGAQDSTNVGLAGGQDFPDALAAAPYLGDVSAPLLLVQQDALPTATEEALELFADDDDTLVETLHVFGGTAAISDEVVQLARQAADPA